MRFSTVESPIMARTFGTWLRREIDARLITQREFARRALLRPETVNGFVMGRRMPRAGLTIAKLAHGLGVERSVVEKQLHLTNRRRRAA
jgi:transcriptional regulator with XRE-family HTH domain